MVDRVANQHSIGNKGFFTFHNHLFAIIIAMLFFRKLLGLNDLKNQRDMRVKFAGDFNDLKPFMDTSRYHLYLYYNTHHHSYNMIEVILLKKEKK